MSLMPTPPSDLAPGWERLLVRLQEPGVRFAACVCNEPVLPLEPARRDHAHDGEPWGWIGRVPAAPEFVPFLTLREQLETVIRYRGVWNAESAKRIDQLLADLSDPHSGRPDMLALAAERPSTWESRPDVSWRVGLARELALAPTNGRETPDPLLLIALKLREARPGWSWRVATHVGRVLSLWSKQTGKVAMVVDTEAFAAQFAEDRVSLLAPTETEARVALTEAIREPDAPLTDLSESSLPDVHMNGKLTAVAE